MMIPPSYLFRSLDLDRSRNGGGARRRHRPRTFRYVAWLGSSLLSGMAGGVTVWVLLTIAG